MARVSIRGEGIPASFRIELVADNSIYRGLLRFAGDFLGTDLDGEGNWADSVSGNL